MPQEIERKFLVNDKAWKELSKPEGQLYRQGYILAEPDKTIRVRQTDKTAYLTIKGITTGASRAEYEYEIPLQDANELLDNFAVTELSKTRYKMPFGGKLWEVDVFTGNNEGLVVAEIELRSEDETFELPAWVGEEVTGDVRYYNSNLTVRPYGKWG